MSYTLLQIRIILASIVMLIRFIGFAGVVLLALIGLIVFGAPAALLFYGCVLLYRLEKRLDPRPGW